MKKNVTRILLLFLLAFALVGCQKKDIQPSSKEETDGSVVETEKETERETIKEESKDDYEKLPDLKVHYIDVGHADCMLIELEGRFMLVDSGDEGDVATVCYYLDTLGVEKLDYVVATHPHGDHIGTMSVVLDQYEIGQVLMSDVEGTTPPYFNMMGAIGRNDISTYIPQVGEVYFFGEAIIQILGPKRIDPEEWNNNSVAFKLTYGDNVFIFAGDAERMEELDICGSGIDISADVLKVNHHGSSSSTHDIFVSMVDPEYAVITCELGNSYGHPTSQTMKTLEKHDIEIFRTDIQGTIIATSDGTNITWNVEPTN